MQQTDHNSLPEPDADARAHSVKLCQLIADKIEQTGGNLPFFEFMQMALYEPGLGYYSAGLSKFGAAGDFITAPELTPLFGTTLAKQIGEILADLDHPNILEFGAGSGRLAVDLLNALARSDQLPEKYYIIEVSADLRHRQEKTIHQHCPQLMERVEWLETLPAGAFDGVILANEVLDAMPVRRFRISESPTAPIEEISVTYEPATDAHSQPMFSETFTPGSGALHAEVRRLEEDCLVPLHAGYISEFNPQLHGWINSLAARLKRGVILCVDYGETRREYYHPERDGGTLLCHYRHRAHADPLCLIGLQDITASVDFTAVAEAAVAQGLSVAGFTSQALFLMNCGLLECLEDCLGDDKLIDDQSRQIAYLKAAQAVKTLTLPDEMGERFKVIALARGYDKPLRGFVQGDRTHHL